MLIGRKAFIAVTGALALFVVTGETQGQTTGTYSPCMVQPVFARPLLSAPLFVPGEVVVPTFAKADSQKWGFEYADFETPAMVQPVIMPPRYDGCVEQSSRRLIETHKAATTIEGKVLMAPPSTAASRIMKGVDICCGAVGGR